MINIEYEYKVMVSKENFNKLKNNFINKKHEKYIQTNYYYDTKDLLLKKSKLSLRIRYIENKNEYLLTLKEPFENVRKEYEAYLKELSFNDIPDEIKEILKKYNIQPQELILLGSLKTTRLEYSINSSLICLDYNQYNHKEDYEIECESNSLENAKKVLINILNENGISYSVSSLSKMARALK